MSECVDYSNFLDHPCVDDTKDCTFTYINSILLITIGVFGFILSSAVILLLVFKIKLPGAKPIFILNVSVNDAVLSIIAIIRGMNFLMHFDDNSIAFCEIYAIISCPFKHNLSLVLIPLTLDRFLAVVYSTKYSALVTPRSSLVACSFSWIFLALLLLYDLIGYFLGSMQLTYDKVQDRCVYNNSRERLSPVIFLLIPTGIIIILYIVMTVVIVKRKIKCGRFFVTSLLIIITNFMTTLPDVLMKTFCIKPNYEVMTFFEVTLFYINGICNPLVYLGANKRAIEQIAIIK